MEDQKGKLIQVNSGKDKRDRRVDNDNFDKKPENDFTSPEDENNLLDFGKAKFEKRLAQIMFFVETFTTITPPTGEEFNHTFLLEGYLNTLVKLFEECPDLLETFKKDEKKINKLIEQMVVFGASKEKFQTPEIQNFMQAIGLTMPSDARIKSLTEELSPTPFQKEMRKVSNITTTIIQALYPDGQYPDDVFRFTSSFADFALNYINRVKSGQVKEGKYDLDNEITREWIVTAISEGIKSNPQLEEDIWKIVDALWLMFNLPQKEETIDDVYDRLGRMSKKKMRQKCYVLTQWIPSLQRGETEEKILKWMLAAYKRDFTPEEKQQYKKEISEKIKQAIASSKIEDSFLFKRICDYFKNNGEQLAA